MNKLFASVRHRGPNWRRTISRPAPEPAHHSLCHTTHHATCHTTYHKATFTTRRVSASFLRRNVERVPEIGPIVNYESGGQKWYFALPHPRGGIANGFRRLLGERGELLAE